MKKKQTPFLRTFVQTRSTNPAKPFHSKKGFTLVEMTVAICIIAILSAIAIPIVAATTKSSVVSKAETNASTIEYAFKEADAAVAGGDNTKYANASTNTIKISEVIAANNLYQALEPENLFGTLYYPVMCKGRVYFAADSNGDNAYNASDKTISGTNLPDNAVALYDKVNNCIIDGNITTLDLSNR